MLRTCFNSLTFWVPILISAIAVLHCGPVYFVLSGCILACTLSIDDDAS